MANKSIVKLQLVIESHFTMAVLERVRGLRLSSVAGFFKLRGKTIVNNSKEHHKSSAGKWAVAIIGIAVLIAALHGGLKAVQRTNQQQTNNKNEPALSSCLNNADNTDTQNINLFYGQAKVPSLSASASPSLISFVTDQLNSEESCYKQYPLTSSNPDNASLQQSCVKNANNYYSQFINLFQTQAALVPFDNTNAGQTELSFINLQKQAVGDCYTYYPTS